MDNLVTKTTDPTQRAKIRGVLALVEVQKEVGGKAFAAAFHADLPEIAGTLRRVQDVLWELDFALHDLLVYEEAT